MRMCAVKTKMKTLADSNARMHLIGRLWLAAGMVLICTIPLWLALYYGVEPEWEVFGSAAVISPMIIMALSGVAEPVIYSPMVGVNGMYLSFLTGNLSNLKIPCVVKAQEIAGTKRGTEEDEIVATIAVATSSLVTILIIGVIVLCLAVIPDLTQMIDDAEYLTPAFGCVVYALFGSLGGKYIVKNPKLAIGPIIIIIVLSVVLGIVGMDPGSAYLFVGIGICLVFAVLQMLREKRKLREKEERQRLEAIAAGMSYEKIVAIEAAQKADENPAPALSAATSEEIEEEAAEEAAELIGTAIEEHKTSKDEYRRTARPRAVRCRRFFRPSAACGRFCIPSVLYFAPTLWAFSLPPRRAGGIIMTIYPILLGSSRILRVKCR